MATNLRSGKSIGEGEKDEDENEELPPHLMVTHETSFSKALLNQRNNSLQTNSLHSRL